MLVESGPRCRPGRLKEKRIALCCRPAICEAFLSSCDYQQPLPIILVSTYLDNSIQSLSPLLVPKMDFSNIL